MNLEECNKWFIEPMTQDGFDHYMKLYDHLKPDLEVHKMMEDYDNFDTMFENFYTRWEGWYFEFEIDGVIGIQLGVKGQG